MPDKRFVSTCRWLRERPFFRDRSGSVAVAFSVCLTSMIGAAALAVDYSRRGNANAILQSAADAAALAASAEMKGNRKDVAAKTFHANASGKTDANVKLAKLDIDINTNAQDIDVVVSFEGSINTVLSKFMGVSTLPLGGTAMASRLKDKFMDIHVVLDTSASMGIAATPQAIKDLMTITLPYLDGLNRLMEPNGCAFGCHSLNHGQVVGDPTFESLAKKNNIPLRFDVVKAALNSLLDAAGSKFTPGNIRAGLYTFNEASQQRVKPTASFGTVRSAIDALVYEGNTDNASVFALLDKDVGAQGDGSSSMKPTKIVVIATDGVIGNRDINNHRAWDPTICASLKAKGIHVAVINTTYPVWDASSYNYNSRIKPFASQITPALKACASSGLYFEAMYASDIKAAFEKFLEAALIVGNMGPRLTK